jgi:hypothetical protein
VVCFIVVVLLATIGTEVKPGEQAEVRPKAHKAGLGCRHFGIHTAMFVGIQLVGTLHFPSLHLAATAVAAAAAVAVAHPGAMAKFSTIISKEPTG